MSESHNIAYFAGGCFWCVQPPFDKTPGVTQTIVGYMDGHKVNPTYKEVCTGQTGHTEAIAVHFDPKKISYDELLKVFWTQIDPTAVNAQFCDKGSQYRTGIYYLDETQKKSAEVSKRQLQDSGMFSLPIATEIKPASVFYPAEDYHQSFYEKNPNHYKCYREESARDEFIARVWKK